MLAEDLMRVCKVFCCNNRELRNLRLMNEGRIC